MDTNNDLECIPDELDLFAEPTAQLAIEDGYYEKIMPITSIENNNIIEFKINSGPDFIDPRNIIFYTKQKIVQQNGADMAPVSSDKEYGINNLVYPCNFMHAGRIKNIEVHINNENVSSMDNCYAYRHYFQTLLSYGPAAKKEQLRYQMFYLDNGVDDTQIDVLKHSVIKESDKGKITNTGAYARLHKTSGSKYFEMFGPLSSDILEQGKLLPPNTEIRIRLHLNDPEFYLMAESNTKQFVVHLASAFLWVKRCKVADSVRAGFEAKLANGEKYIYPCRRMETKYFTFARGRSDLSLPNMINGRIPRRIVFGVVESAGFNGKYNKNPFNFQPFSMRNIVLRYNTQPIPWSAIEINTSDGHFAQAYMALCQGASNLYHDRGIAISPEQYPHGCTIFAFDISSSWLNEDCDIDTPKQGKISLEIKLSLATEETLTLVALLEYDSIIKINKDGDVLSY